MFDETEFPRGGWEGGGEISVEPAVWWKIKRSPRCNVLLPASPYFCRPSRKNHRKLSPTDRFQPSRIMVACFASPFPFFLFFPPAIKRKSLFNWLTDQSLRGLLIKEVGRLVEMFPQWLVKNIWTFLCVWQCLTRQNYRQNLTFIRRRKSK